ncbi:hypothetical protein IMSAGC011_01612 [Lachnospiraceae bacterium]|nr:hypothetical protein IMSAGC011_01612 [Lachnospiraceae bacterium]
MPVAKIITMLFPGARRKALTLSYDDGVLQDRQLIQMMNQYQIRGTFNLNSRILGRVEKMTLFGKTADVSTVTLEEIPVLYAAHEIATHGAEHSALTGYGSAGLLEVMDDRRIFEATVPYLVRGHAYPFGLYNDMVCDMLKAAGITYGRTVTSTRQFDIPKDFMRWDPTCHHNDPEVMELAKQFCEKDSVFGQPQLFYLWGHSYEFDMEQNWQDIEKFLKYVSGFQSTVWMATNGEIADYVTAYRMLIFSADGSRIYNPTAATLWMEILGKVYEINAGETVTIR